MRASQSSQAEHRPSEDPQHSQEAHRDRLKGQLPRPRVVKAEMQPRGARVVAMVVMQRPRLRPALTPKVQCLLPVLEEVQGHW